MSLIDPLLKVLSQSPGSDLHLSVGRPPHLKRQGQLQPLLRWPSFEERELIQHLQSICPPGLWERFQERGELEFAHFSEEIARFRVSYYQSAKGPVAVFRAIPTRLPVLEDLKLPEVVECFSQLRQGLLLLGGASGSGRSTTLAALIDDINRQRAVHILSLESPIEFLYRNERALVTQREVGKHLCDLSDGLKAARRQDCDVIAIGRLTCAAALREALRVVEGGSLVIAVVENRGVQRILGRLLSLFSEGERPKIRSRLGESLRAVVSQILVPAVDGQHRLPAVELLLGGVELRNALQANRLSALHGIIRGGREAGMQSQDDALFALVKRNRILGREAFRLAEDKQRFVAFLESARR